MPTVVSSLSATSVVLVVQDVASTVQHAAAMKIVNALFITGKLIDCVQSYEITGKKPNSSEIFLKSFVIS